MLKCVAILFVAIVGASLAPAQTVIPVGAGSYASFPPAQAGGTAQTTSTQALYVVSDNVQPVPSNKWWTDLVIDRYAGNMWAYPLTVSANAQGVNISDPVNWGLSGTTPQLGVGSVISVQGQGFSAVDARALSWGDWTVSYRLQQATNQLIDVTVGHGLPFVWMQFTGVSPQIQGSGAAYFDDSGNALTLPTTTDHIGISYAGQYWGVFAPDNTQFGLSNGVVNVTFAGTNQFLVVGVLPAKSNLSYFEQYAYALPTNSVMNWAYDPNAGTVTTSWHLAMKLLKGTQTNTIQGWLAHHWRNTTNNLAFNGINYSVARGPMKCATGSDFQIVYKFNGILPTLPAPTTLGLTNDFNAARMASYITSVAANTSVAVDTYWGGKDMLRYAQHMAFASQLGRPEFTTLENTLRSALTNWLTYTPNESSYYFAAYPGWKALVGFQASYGADQFNDQHFHYGYFTHSAALLGMYDQSFVANYGPMLRLVAKEYANWDRSDTNFPFMRTFDIWSGHSQASGFPDSTRGGNQESSSEAVQSWGGLFLLGSMMGDNQMQAAGAMGYVMESTAVREYWFNEHGDVWPSVYTPSVVGILWDNGQDYQTYFGLVPIYVHAIQWLPPSPIMSYLVANPAFAQQNFNSMMTEQLAQIGTNSISSMGSEWGNYALGYAAQFNPGYVAGQLDQLWTANDPVATDVTYVGVTYYQTHSIRKLGGIQWQFHLSVPMSAVYYNTNTAQYTYLAYNPLTNSQVATIYSNNVAVGTLLLPAQTLTSQTALGPGVPVVTNVVPALVRGGVGISWPTVAGTNYVVQSATNLPATGGWTNLSATILGNGATNQLFDPAGNNPQKYYRVQQSP